MDKDEIIKELAEENAKLKEELQVTKEHLKKYTAPASSKVRWILITATNYPIPAPPPVV